MNKLVVLTMDGDLKYNGFRRVILEIGEEGAIASTRMTGSLPPNPELAEYLRSHWQEKYPRAGVAARIKPQEIIFGGSVNHISECQESENKLIILLNEWLKYEKFRTLSDRLLASLNPEDTIRFLIRTECRDIPKLPWHKWDFSQRYRRAEIAFSSLEYERNGNVRQKIVKNKIRILAILGDSTGIDIEADRKIIENLPNAETTFLRKPELYKLNDRLWEQPWDILFFAGHSKTEDDTGLFYINETDSITIDELWYALRKAVERGLKLAIFNSCDGLGLARQLDDVQVPQMIVMRERVPDRVAQEFLKHFLRGFASGTPLYLAAREARERLQGLERTYPCACWLPVIWQNPAEVPPTWAELSGQTASLPIALPLPEKKETLPRGNWRSFKSALLASLICAIAVMGVRYLGLLQPWELHAYDRFMQMRAIESPDPRLLIVAADEEDIRQYGHPLPDAILAQMLDKLEQHHPAVIGLNIYRDLPQTPGYEAMTAHFKQNNLLISTCKFIGTEEGINPPPASPVERVGFINLQLDDGREIVRRDLLSRTANTISNFEPCNTDFSFGFLLVFRYLNLHNYSIKTTPEKDWQFGNILFKRLENRAGGYQDLDARGNQILLNYRSASKIAQKVTVRDILNDKFQPSWVKDKIVTIGVTAESVADREDTPLGKMHKLLIQAHAVSQIISAVEDKRPLIGWLPFWGDIIWVGIWSFTGGAIAAYLKTSPLRLSLAIALNIVILYAICFVLFAQGGYWLPLIPSALALVAAGGTVVLGTAYTRSSN